MYSGLTRALAVLNLSTESSLLNVVSPRGPYWDQCSSISLSMTWTVGLSVVLASLLTMLRWMMHLIQKKKERTPSKGLEKWALVNRMKLHKSNGRCSTWVRAIPDMGIDWEKNTLRAVLWRWTWRSWWAKSWTWANSVYLQPRRPAVSWDGSIEGWLGGQGSWLSPSTLSL